MNRQLFDWNTEAVEKLKELVQLGYSASQIAKAFGGGVSRNAVIGKVQRMGWRLAESKTRVRI